MPSIFKYYAPNDYSHEALSEKYFWFSKAHFLNDPYDVCAEVIELFPHFKDALCKKYGNFDSYYERVQKFAICCFTTDCKNKHMWALYANSYKGWCLEFESEQIIDTPSTGVPSKLYDVHYIEEYPNFNDPNLQLDILTRNGSSKLNDFIKDERDEDLLFTYLLSLKEKSIWEQEYEKRVFLGNVYYHSHPEEIASTESGFKIPWNNGKLKAIIMGSNISDEDKLFLEQQAEETHVALKQIRPIVPSINFDMEIVLVKDYSIDILNQ